MNMEGEGVKDANTYFRKKLVRMGVVKPSEDEAQELMAEMQNQPPDPNTLYLQAAAQEAEAKAAKARADTVETIASAELKHAQTVKTLSETGGESPVIDLNQKKAELELMKMERELQIAEEKHAFDLFERGVKVEKDDKGRSRARSEIDVRSEQIGTQVAEAVSSLKDVIENQSAAMQAQADAIMNASILNAESQSKTAEVLSKPRRIVREKGKIVGLKIEG